MKSNRMDEQIEVWKRDLIDLTRRNSLLNTTSRAVGFSIELPSADAVLSAIISRKPLSIEIPEDVETDDLVPKDANLESKSSKEKAAREVEQSSTRESDRPLRAGQVRTSYATAERARTALRTLKRRSDQEFLDKGLRILYLAFGSLTWRERDDEWISPILLVPIDLMKSKSGEFSIVLNDDDDLVVNPALLEKLRIILGDSQVFAPELDEDDPSAILTAFEVLASPRKGWSVTTAARVGLYSFAKEVMYRDLASHTSEIASSELVQALAFGSEADVDLSFPKLAEPDLDVKFPPTRLSSILDADATQRQAIVAAKCGRSFVIDGPPGTGKSQTIANIICELIADGKSVLFVSEKAAALEVVQKRLDGAGIGSFLLPLHSQKITRKAFAGMLLKAANERAVAGKKFTKEEVEKYESTQKSLSAYCAAMNEERLPLGRTLHDVIGEYLQLDDCPVAPIPLDVIDKDLAPSTLIAIEDQVTRASLLWDAIDDYESYRWRGLSNPVDADARRSVILGNLESLIRSTNDLRSQAEQVAEDSGLDAPEEIGGCRGLIELARLFDMETRSPATWLATDDFESLQSSLLELCQRLESIELGAAALGELGSNWETSNSDIFNELTTALAELESLGYAPLDIQQAFKDFADDVDEYERDIDALVEAADAAAQLERRFTGEAVEVSLSRAKVLQEAGEIARAAHRPEAIWFSAVGIQAARDSIEKVAPLVDDYRRRMSKLDEVFSSDIENFDAESVFEPNSDVPAIGLLGKGRRNRQRVTPYMKDGKAARDLRDRLVELREAQRLRNKINDEANARASLGAYYFQGTNTDFFALSEALNSAEQAVRLLEGADPKHLEEALSRASLSVAETESLTALVQRGLQILDAHPERFGPSAPGGDTTFATVIERARRGSECWKSIRAVLLTLLPRHSSASLQRAFELCQLRTAYEAAVQELPRRASEWKIWLGESFNMEKTDRLAVLAKLEWAHAVRSSLEYRLTRPAAERLLSDGPVSTEPVRDALETFDHAKSSVLEEFKVDRQSELEENFDAPIDDVLEFVDSLISSTDQVGEQVGLQEALNELEALGMGDVVQFVLDHRVRGTELPGTFKRAILAAWIESVIKSDKKRLSPLERKARNAAVQSFADLDRKLSHHAAALVTERASQARPTTTIGAMGLIQREAQKKTRHMRITELLAKTTDVVQRIVPCFMMSPLSVSAFLPPNMVFDVVIFDEASQIMTSNAVNCVYRGRQLIVAGDEKQMPPSSFFAVTNEVDDEYEEDGLDDFESLLYQANAGGFENLGLRWHYRSRHESLITYSNQSFYGGNLVTYPSARGISDQLGVSFIHVPDGVYLRSGRRSNPIEAQKVAERVIFHADHNPDMTLGVVAFSAAQADEIQNALDFALRDRPDLDDYFTTDRLDGFFIKNLENVQGDERDTIIFSVGYGRDENGKLTMNFGPVNKPKGWRRLNVAFTRARSRVELISSITAEDFTEVSNESVNYLRTYLDYAARGAAALAWSTVPQTGETESVFEHEVVKSIQSWGYQVDAQVGQAGYRIDIGVRDPQHPGSYILGVECDGAAYHSSQVARDRDRLRQEVLEGLGWNFYRIWGPTWFRGKKTAEEDLRAAIEKAEQEGSIHSPTNVRRRTKTASANVSSAIAMKTIEVDLNDQPDWIEPYFNRPKMRTPEVRTTSSGTYASSTYDDLILAIVEWEGPVDRAIIQKRFATFFGMNRTKRVQSLVDQRLDVLKSNKRVDHWRPDCFAMPGQRVDRVRKPEPGDELTKRSSRSFPAGELRMAIYRVLLEAGPLDREELYNVVVKVLLGLTTLTRQWRDRLEEEVDYLSSRFVELDGRQVRAISEPS